MANPPEILMLKTFNVVPKHVEMHMKCMNQSGKKMATYNLNAFVWALKDSIPILELTPTNKDLKESWLIRSLLYIRGEDAPFIQAVKPGENVDEAPILNEQSVKVDEESSLIVDHDPAAATQSNKLLEDVDSLFKEMIDVRQDLVERVDELRTKLLQTLTSSSHLFLTSSACSSSSIKIFFSSSNPLSGKHIVTTVQL
uniref:Uncharacterized protein n=1 Tax=Tanacetum cinerariifolium TaxID=118510 RepID=A0A699HN23_TANCI|nr:hypothetical protein [Tanacetum cinerariifolium]